MFKPTSKKCKVLLLGALPIFSTHFHAVASENTPKSSVKTCKAEIASGEVTQYNHFIEPTGYTMENFAEHHQKDNLGKFLTSSVSNRKWAHLYRTPNAENINSVKWYGLITARYENSSAANAIHHGNQLRVNYSIPQYNKAKFKIDFKSPEGFISKTNNTKHLSSETHRQFIGVPKVKVKSHWILNVPEGEFVNTNQQHLWEHLRVIPKIQRTNDASKKVTHVYLVEYSANIPTTCFSELNTQSLFVSVNPLHNEFKLINTNIVAGVLTPEKPEFNWSFIIADEIGSKNLNNATIPSFIERQENISAPVPLKARVRNEDGTPYLADPNHQTGSSRGANDFSLSLGIFADKLANVPVFDSYSFLASETKVTNLTISNQKLGLDNKRLQSSLQTEQSFKEAERNRANKLATQLDVATAKAAMLSIKNSQIASQKNQLIIERNKLAAEKQSLTAEKSKLSSEKQALVSAKSKAALELKNLKAHIDYGWVKRLRNKASNKCLDLAKNSNGSYRLITWTCHNGDNQKWKYIVTTGQLKSISANLCLEVSSEVYSKNTPKLTVKTCAYPLSHTGYIKRQKFIRPLTSSVNQTLATQANPNLVLDATGTHNNAAVIMHPHNNGNNQKWEFIN